MKTVLLVEDDDFIRKMYVLKLSRAKGFKIVEAQDGDVALELIAKQKPDLMLLDLMMPKKSGLEVLQDLKNKKISIDTIILSNVLSDEMRSQAKSLGVKDYIIKASSTPSDVLQKIQTTLGLAQ
ncbi:response regulator [Candidatus Saccharibacteria bacterium]|nr:response regulator [Candidatus Saccharibacteria bacterium]